MKIAEELNFSVENVLPLIKSRSEAEALLTVILLGQQLDAAVRSLMASIEYEKLLLTLRDAATRSGNCYDTAVAASIHQAVELSRKRLPSQVIVSTKLIENLCRLEVSIRQYGQQNLTISQELQEHAPDVAALKLTLSAVELDLCARMNVVLRFSQESLTATAAHAIVEQAQSLQQCNYNLDERKKEDAHDDLKDGGRQGHALGKVEPQCYNTTGHHSCHSSATLCEEDNGNENSTNLGQNS